jgi:hypothetical protein
MWVVRPEFDKDDSPSISIIHIDTIIRAVHLIGVCRDDFLPKTLCFHDSLDTFRAFFVNKYADHHAFEIAF